MLYGTAMLGPNDVIAIAVVPVSARRECPTGRNWACRLPSATISHSSCPNSAKLRLTVVSEVAQDGYTVLGWPVADISTVVRVRDIPTLCTFSCVQADP
jgi:hypothetical protein